MAWQIGSHRSDKESLIRLSLRNSFFSSLGSVASLLITAFVAGYSIRILGESLAGFIMIMQTIVGVSGSLSDFGFGTTVVKAVSEAHSLGDKKRIHDTLGATSFFNIAVALSLGTVIAILSHYIVAWSKLGPAHFDQARASIYFYAAAFVLNAGSSSYRAIPSALERFDYTSLLTVGQAIVSGGIQTYVLLFSPSIVNLSIGSLISAVVQLALALIIGHHLLGEIVVPRKSWKALKELLPYSTIVFFTLVVYMVRGNSDKWVLTSIEGAVALPGYVIGQMLMQRILSFVSTPFYFVFPMLSSSSVELDRNKVFAIYRNFHWFVSLIGSFIFTAIAFNSFWILEFWIKRGFAVDYNYLFQMACFQGVFASMSIVPHFSSFGLNKPANNLREGLVSGSVVLLLSLILIPLMGALGAAITQLSAYVIVTLFIQLQMKVTVFGEQTFRAVIKPIFPSLLVGALLMAVALSLNLSNFYTGLSVVKVVMLNMIVLLAAVSAVLFERFPNRKSGRYQIVAEVAAIARRKMFAVIG